MNEPQKIVRGWLIALRDADSIVPDKCLSLKSGDFVSELAGSLFPSKQAAEAYAAEFGFVVEHNVAIVEGGF